MVESSPMVCWVKRSGNWKGVTVFITPGGPLSGPLEIGSSMSRTKVLTGLNHHQPCPKCHQLDLGTKKFDLCIIKMAMWRIYIYSTDMICLVHYFRGRYLLRNSENYSWFSLTIWKREQISIRLLEITLGKWWLNPKKSIWLGLSTDSLHN